MSRAYFFGNMYLSSIQQGIQAAHVVGDMAVKYQRLGDDFTVQGQMFYDWAEDHKVMILLNAGYGENILAMNDFFEGIEDSPNAVKWPGGYYSPYPFAMFSESDEALGGAATSLGVILPAKIYNGAEAMRKIKRLRRDDITRLAWDNQRVLTVDLYNGEPAQDVVYNEFDVELMKRLGTFRLAQ